jgi:hypothetical protein
MPKPTSASSKARTDVFFSEFFNYWLIISLMVKFGSVRICSDLRSPTGSLAKTCLSETAQLWTRLQKFAMGLA